MPLLPYDAWRVDGTCDGHAERSAHIKHANSSHKTVSINKPVKSGYVT